MALSSVALAGQIGVLTESAGWFAVLPALDLAADLAEDALLVRFLLAPESVGPSMVRSAHRLTTLKIWSGGLAIAQTVVLPVTVPLLMHPA